MTSVKDILWGSYKEYEGPWFGGSIKYELPNDNLSESDRRIRVLTATEGGSYDAVNAYDRCIVSVGLIQWCEGQYYLVSKLLHAIIEESSPSVVLDPLKTALDMSCAEFKKNKDGNWRFFFLDSNKEVNTIELQQKLFLGCDGKIGSWTPAAKMQAKLWAASFANIWNNEDARKIQVRYTASRLLGFLMKESKEILWDSTPDTGNTGALRAAYLSYAGNLPAVANKHLLIAVNSTTAPKWSQSWCISILKQLTFGPEIKIYPHRYDKIRPWLESLWDGVSLPKTSVELREWVEPKQKEPQIEIPTNDNAQVHVEVVPEAEPILPDGVDSKELKIVLRPPVVSTLPTNTNTPEGILGWILNILGVIASYIYKRKVK